MKSRVKRSFVDLNRAKFFKHMVKLKSVGNIIDNDLVKKYE